MQTSYYYIVSLVAAPLCRVAAAAAVLRLMSSRCTSNDVATIAFICLYLCKTQMGHFINNVAYVGIWWEDVDLVHTTPRPMDDAYIKKTFRAGRGYESMTWCSRRRRLWMPPKSYSVSGNCIAHLFLQLCKSSPLPWPTSIMMMSELITDPKPDRRNVCNDDGGSSNDWVLSQCAPPVSPSMNVRVPLQ